MNKIFIIILIFSSSLYAPDFPVNEVCPLSDNKAGLVGLWHMDVDEDPITDSSGNSHPLSLKGAGEPNFTSSGYFGGAYDFDGADDYITYASHADWNFGTGDFTVACWVYYDGASVTDSIYVAVLDAIPVFTAYPFILVQQEPEAVLQVYLDSGGADSQYSWTPTLNTWYYIVSTRIGTDLKLYIDAVEVDSDTNSDDVDQGILIMGGGQMGVDSFYHEGLIDDPAILKGRGVSAEEIYAIYHEQVKRH